MKTRILVTIALVAGMMLAGCSKDEENMEQFTIDTEQISILAGDDYKVIPSGEFTARSTDEDVATVSTEGMVHGVSAGEADVVFTSAGNAQSRTCKVSVDWRYKYFDEPILDFSMNLEQLKARETHQIWGENWWDTTIEGANDPWLIRYKYDTQELSILACYAFLDKTKNVLNSVTLEFDRAQGIGDKIRAQMTERYGESGKDSEGYTQFVSVKKGVKIRILGNYAIYFPL